MQIIRHPPPEFFVQWEGHAGTSEFVYDFYWLEVPALSSHEVCFALGNRNI